MYLKFLYFVIAICLFISQAQAQTVSTTEPPTLNNSYNALLGNAVGKPADPAGYLHKIEMYDNITVFFVMPNEEIMSYNTNGELVKVGIKKRPPLGRETEFNYMVKLENITYAVDKKGFVWQQVYPYKEIVGSIANYTNIK